MTRLSIMGPRKSVIHVFSFNSELDHNFIPRLGMKYTHEYSIIFKIPFWDFYSEFWTQNHILILFFFSGHVSHSNQFCQSLNDPNYFNTLKCQITFVPISNTRGENVCPKSLSWNPILNCDKYVFSSSFSFTKLQSSPSLQVHSCFYILAHLPLLKLHSSFLYSFKTCQSVKLYLNCYTKALNSVPDTHF